MRSASADETEGDMELRDLFRKTVADMFGGEKFVFEEISANDQIPLDAENLEALFGMENNPAMRFVGRSRAIAANHYGQRIKNSFSPLTRGGTNF